MRLEFDEKNPVSLLYLSAAEKEAIRRYRNYVYSKLFSAPRTERRGPDIC